MTAHSIRAAVVLGLAMVVVVECTECFAQRGRAAAIELMNQALEERAARREERLSRRQGEPGEFGPQRPAPRQRPDLTGGNAPGNGFSGRNGFSGQQAGFFVPAYGIEPAGFVPQTGFPVVDQAGSVLLPPAPVPAPAVPLASSVATTSLKPTPAAEPLPATPSAGNGTKSSGQAGPSKPRESGSIRISLAKVAKDRVTYSLNGTPFSMLPGEQQVLDNDRDWVIQFDRGQRYGLGKYSLSPGNYRFKSTERGIELVKVMPKAMEAPEGKVPEPSSAGEIEMQVKPAEKKGLGAFLEPAKGF